MIEGKQMLPQDDITANVWTACPWKGKTETLDLSRKGPKEINYGGGSVGEKQTVAVLRFNQNPSTSRRDRSSGQLSVSSILRKVSRTLRAAADCAGVIKSHSLGRHRSEV